MVNKIFASPLEAVADIQDGATIMIGGFLGAGAPNNLIDALIEKGVKKLTVITNAICDFFPLANAGLVNKVITSVAVMPSHDITGDDALEEQIDRGEVEVEIVPEGILSERVRAGGVGIPAFYSPCGLGSVVEEGKEKKIIDGKEYILERALRADFALIRGYKGDRYGNIVYRMVARNINPIMAMAADVTIAEVEEIVNVGELDPEVIVTPGIFVNRIVKAKRLNRSFMIPVELRDEK